MLDHVNAGRLSLQRLIDLTSAGPARLYGLAKKGQIHPGFDADLSLVDLKSKRISKCPYSPILNPSTTHW